MNLAGVGYDYRYHSLIFENLILRLTAPQLLCILVVFPWTQYFKTLIEIRTLRHVLFNSKNLQFRTGL